MGFVLKHADGHVIYDAEAKKPKEGLLEALQKGVDITGAQIASKYLVGLKAIARTMRDVRFDISDLSSAELRHADLRGSSFVTSDLAGADLTGADLRGCNLRGAHLTGTILFDADLRGADVTGADMDMADIEQAKVDGAIGFGVPDVGELPASTTARRVMYSKIGRSLILDPKQWGAVGGDNEPMHLLLTLAARHPDVEWVIAGRHSGDPGNLPPNVIVPMTPKTAGGFKTQQRKLHEYADGAVVWLGQHGTSNNPIPMDDPRATALTRPQKAFRIYAAPIISGLNGAADKYEPVWLCADPRNYLKARDVKQYPRMPILGQYVLDRTQNHYRWDDRRTPEECGLAGVSQVVNAEKNFWGTHHSYIYSGLELTGVPRWEDETWATWEQRKRFGIVINENRSYVTLDRPTIVRDWVTPLRPDFICGKWSTDGQVTAGLEIAPVHYLELQNTLSLARSTFTTPASGSRWATAKPWECFALNVVCFFHPAYDDQGHIIPTLEQVEANEVEDYTLRELARWLRVRTPTELEERVNAVDASPEVYTWLVTAQRRRLRQARDTNLAVRLIERRLGLPSAEDGPVAA